MPRPMKTNYLVRNLPESLGKKLRESALLEECSLNQVMVNALDRGMGLSNTPVRYRNLRTLAQSPTDRKSWNKVLQEMDQTHPDDWK